jgi:DNA-binding transcriptional LysR family regulator
VHPGQAGDDARHRRGAGVVHQPLPGLQPGDQAQPGHRADAEHGGLEQIAVELVPGNVPIDLARGEADLAVRTVAAEEADIVRRRLGEVRYGLYASARYLKQRGAVAEVYQLAGHDVLVPSRELASGPEASWVATRAGRANPVFYASSHVTIAGAAAAGMGLAVFPDNLARLHPELQQVRPLPEIPARPVWLAMHRDLRRVSRVRVVADAVAGAIAETLA